MTKLLPEALAFAALCERHASEWPDDVKKAADRIVGGLTAAHTKSFQNSKVLTNGLARDLADFYAKLNAWQRLASFP